MTRFWLWLARFAFRRMAGPDSRIPTRIPTIRDPEARCSGYAPRARREGDWDCQGDGHYLCGECAHRRRCTVCAEPTPPMSDGHLCEKHEEEAYQRDVAPLYDCLKEIA
jgi:hypothetical protein